MRQNVRCQDSPIQKTLILMTIGIYSVRCGRIDFIDQSTFSDITRPIRRFSSMLSEIANGRRQACSASRLARGVDIRYCGCELLRMQVLIVNFHTSGKSPRESASDSVLACSTQRSVWRACSLNWPTRGTKVQK